LLRGLIGIGCLIICSFAVQASDPLIKIGVLAHRGKENVSDRWTQTAKYLSEKIPGFQFQIFPLDLQEMNTAVALSQVDFVLTNPSHYVSLEVRNGISRIATLKRNEEMNLHNLFTAVIFTRADHPKIETLEDAKGKHFIAVNDQAFGGYQMAWLEFKRRNIDIKQDFSRVTFSGYPQDKVVYAIKNGLADVGTVRARTLAQMIKEGLVKASDFRILGSRHVAGFPFVHSTDLYPEWPLSKLSHTKTGLAEQVAAALMNMPFDHPAARSAGLAGWTVPMDYKPVHEMLRELGVGPYAYKREISLVQVWRKYKVWVLLGLTVLIALSVIALLLKNMNKRLATAKISLEAEIEHRKQAEQELFETNEKALVVLSSISNAVISTNPQGLVTYVNPVAQKFIGDHVRALVALSLSDLFTFVDSRTEEEINDPVAECIGANSTLHYENWLVAINRQGREIEVELSVSPMRDQVGKIVGTVLVMQDVTEMKKLQQQMQYQAHHDFLTGLLNRHAFEQYLASALVNAHELRQDHALLYMDLDRFKLVNDSCGHAAGDALLKEITAEMQTVISKDDVFARLGGDEFAVLLCDCDLDNASQVAERIRYVVESFRFVWEQNTFDLGVSIGVMALTRENDTINEVLSTADNACYIAKERGRNKVYVYSPGDRVIARRYGEVQWMHQIRDALLNNRFYLYAQPIQALNSDAAPQVHWELLVRLRHENGSLIAPKEFIPAAERYHQMPALDRWVTEHAIQLLSEHDVAQSNKLRCFINLSGQTLSDGQFLRFAIDTILRYGVEPGSLVFEVTETAAIANFQKAARLISVLREMGCRFALDDFGTGLSSFAYLKQLPVDYIKIDGSFIQHLVEDEVACAIAQSISDISHTMGVLCIAETVENEAVLQKVRQIGLDYAQGFCIAQPVPLEVAVSELAQAEHDMAEEA